MRKMTSVEDREFEGEGSVWEDLLDACTGFSLLSSFARVKEVLYKF